MLFHSSNKKASSENFVQNAANTSGPKTPSRKPAAKQAQDECGYYTFIGNPANKEEVHPLLKCGKHFSSFFEKNGHTRIKPYPVVARWRNDIYLTHASIIDFQPYVTEGISPPPANPLVISQPSIRLTDIPILDPLLAGT